MNNNHVLGELPAYVSGELDDESRGAIQLHLSLCEQCRNEFDKTSRLWTELGRVPEEQPSSMFHTRFHDMLNTFERDIRRKAVAMTRKRWYDHLLPQQPAIQLGIIAFSIMVGIFIGTRINNNHQDNRELIQLHEEVRDMNRLLTVSLLKQQSASERLRGVSLSYQSQQQDPEVTAALLHTLKYDPNVNVRLSALDAIAHSLDNGNVRNELLESLPKQSSPLLQIAIVDLMVQARERQSLQIFKQMVRDPELNSSVKKKIEQGIQQLS